MRLTIRINGEAADFFDAKELVPAIYKRFIDFSDPFAVVGDYTLGLTLPPTSKNRRILGYIGYVDVNTPVFDYPYKAQIELDEVILIKGDFKILEYNKAGIKCSLIGDNISWGSLFDGRNLRETNLGTVPYSGFRSENYHPYKNQTPNTVAALDVWETFEQDGLYTFQVPFIAYGNFPVVPFGEDQFGDPVSILANPFTGFGNIEDALGFREGAVFVNNRISTLDTFANFPLAPYLKTTVKAVFNDAGYSISGEWFSDANTDNLLLPFTGEDLPFNSRLLSMASVEMVSPIIHYNPSGYSFRSDSGSVTFNSYGISNETNQPVYRDVSFVSGQYNYGVTAFNLLDCLINTNENWSGGFGPGVNGYFIGYNDSIGENYFKNLIAISPFDLTQNYTDIDPEKTGDCQFRANSSGNWRFSISFEINGDMKITRGLQPIICIFKNSADLSDFVSSPVSSDPLIQANNPILLNNPDIVYIQRINYAQTSSITQNGYTQQIYDNGSNTFTFAGDIELNEEDTLNVFLILPHFRETNTGFPQNIFQFQVNSLFVDFYNTSLPEEVNVGSFLPDIEIKDFLRSVFDFFNLVPVVDESSKAISLLPRPSYFLPSITAIDWSTKTNLESATITPINAFKNVTFQFAEEDDRGYTKGDFDLTLTSDSTYTNKATTIEFLFAPTPDRTFKFFNTQNEFLTFNLPSISDKDGYLEKLGEATGPNYSKTPRILKWNGLTTFPLGESLYVDSYEYRIGDWSIPNFPIGNYGLPLASFIDTGTSDFNLSFSNLPSNGKTNLYEKYWKAYVEFILSSYLLSFEVMLKPSDISNLDIRRPIKIGNQLFYVNLIDGFRPLMDSTTKVQMIKKINI